MYVDLCLFCRVFGSRDDLPTKDSSHAAQVTSQSDKVLSQSNFRDDVNVDGVMISATDYSPKSEVNVPFRHGRENSEEQKMSESFTLSDSDGSERLRIRNA